MKLKTIQSKENKITPIKREEYISKETQELMDKMNEFMKETLSSKEKCREFLYKTGIYTKTGRLRKPYR